MEKICHYPILNLFYKLIFLTFNGGCSSWSWVKNKSSFYFFRINYSDFYFYIILILRGNKYLENQERLLKAKSVFLIGWDLDFCCLAIYVIDWSFHLLVKYFLHIFYVTFNFEILKRVFSTCWKYFYRRASLICIFKHFII